MSSQAARFYFTPLISDWDSVTDGVYNYNTTNTMNWNGNEDVRYRLISWITQIVNIYHMANHGSLVRGSGCYGETTEHTYILVSNQNPVWAMARPDFTTYSPYQDSASEWWTSTVGAEFQRTSTSTIVTIWGGASSDVCINFG